MRKYEEAIKDLGNPDRVLFLNDLLGGRSYNAACRPVIGNQNFAIAAGKDGVLTASYESLNAASDDDEL